jgi:hypothetical protein
MIPAITDSIQAYFDLMYDSDDTRFPAVFHEGAIVQGMRDGTLTIWSAQAFRDIMRSRPSPKSMQSPREEFILRIDCTSQDLATAKVRVRIGQTRFIDELTLHRIEGRFMVTSKAFHVDSIIPPEA